MAFKFSSVVLISILISGCSTVGPKEHALHVELRKPTARDGKGEIFTQYINNDSTRLCYTFLVPGEWKPSNESGKLESREGRATVGVLVWSENELAEFEGSSLEQKAAKKITGLFETDLGKLFETDLGKRASKVNLVPFQSQTKPWAMKWHASWSIEKSGVPYLAQASKVFVEIAPGWVAQITVQTSDDDRMAREIIDTLATTKKPGCYSELLSGKRFWTPSIRRPAPPPQCLDAAERRRFPTLCY